MSDQYGNNVDGEIWVPVHNHFSIEMHPTGLCPACDQQYDRSMGVPVCYKRHQLGPWISQSVPHLQSECEP